MNVVMCLFYRSFPEIHPNPPIPPFAHPHPPRPPQPKEQKSHLLPAEHPKRSLGWRGLLRSGGGCLLFQREASHGTVKIPPFVSFHFSPHLVPGRFFFFFFSLFIFLIFEIFGVYLVFTSIWRRPGGNCLRHMFCQARSGRPIRVAKCWIRLIMMQC